MNTFPFARTRAARRARRLTLVGVTGTLVVAGGAGYAAWTAQASGTSQASSLTAVTASVTVHAGPADLYPGASGAVHFTVTNPNDYPVRFTAADFGTVASSDETACPNTHVTVNDTTGLVIDVAAGATTTSSVPAGVTLSSAAPDGCQGKAFVITTTLSGLSV